MQKTRGLYLHTCSRVFKNCEGTVILFNLSTPKLKVPSNSIVHCCSNMTSISLSLLARNGRDFSSARPDITHQSLLMLFDSPLNRAGLLQVRWSVVGGLVHHGGGRWISSGCCVQCSPNCVPGVHQNCQQRADRDQPGHQDPKVLPSCHSSPRLTQHPPALTHSPCHIQHPPALTPSPYLTSTHQPSPPHSSPSTHQPSLPHPGRSSGSRG